MTWVVEGGGTRFNSGVGLESYPSSGLWKVEPTRGVGHLRLS